jgi:hypothetical protein
MGKLIISETERKNILSLYEATTVAPPPSESVLVVNKNPFKYPEYKLSRKLYSTQLKDGDTFYILSKQNNIITSYNEIINNLIKIYQEKSIRYNDEIVKISMKLNEYSSGKLDKDYFPYITALISGYIGGNKEYEISYLVEPNNYKILLGYYRINYISTSPYYEMKKYFVVPNEVSEDPVYKFFVSFKNDLLKNLQPLKIENLPDEYFEIRKIQREKTDF